MLGLVSPNVREIPFQSFQWWNLHRENSIQRQTNLVPAKFVGRYGEFRFRTEEVVKTSLFHTRLLTDLVDTHRAITLPPDKFMRSLQETQLGITKPHSTGKILNRSGNRKSVFCRQSVNVHLLAGFQHPNSGCKLPLDKRWFADTCFAYDRLVRSLDIGRILSSRFTRQTPQSAEPANGSSK